MSLVGPGQKLTPDSDLGLSDRSIARWYWGKYHTFHISCTKITGDI